MTAAVLDPLDPAGSLASSMSRRRKIRNGFATAWLVGAVLVALVPLTWVMITVVSNGRTLLSWEFLTANIPISKTRVGPGMGPAVLGTLLITAAASLLAIPLGILGAIYLNEYGKQKRFASIIRFMANVMTGVPSIVMGLFIAIVYVPMKGYSGFAGALALACLMLPIVIRSTEEMLKLVPDTLRQASYGLGARRSSTILRVVLPAALPGLTSGSLLAVARSAGETAPLLFTTGI